MLRSLALAALLGCSGVSAIDELPPSCEAGVLTVLAPAHKIRARFPEGSTTHRCEPPMHFAMGGTGFLVFTPRREADVYVIESAVYRTGEPVCPLEVEVRP